MCGHRLQYPASCVSRKRIEKCQGIGQNDYVVNPKVKLTAYAVLLILAVWFGLAFRSKYAAVTKAAAVDLSDTSSTETPQPAPTNTETPPSATTNAATNVTAEATNATTATNAPAPAPAPPPAAPPPVSAPEPALRGAMVGYLAGLILVLIGLGIMIAIDVTQYVGGQASSFLFFDVGDAMRDPDYEKAEAEWANGKFLEAVQLLRDYLKKNPRELHAALRIAEIYEKDLKNHLASALEYEEVLKHKLPSERWGWAAIHLCNLYSRLNQKDKTLALLHRIVDEYPRTAAARKARGRLGIAEPEEPETPTEPVVEIAAPEVEIEAEAPEPEPPSPPPEPPKSNLPPGFRPKG
jgi:TolA-binding protein